MYWNAFWQGLALILTLIVAIGPQNILVLRHALMRKNAIFSAAITGFYDSVMLIIGIMGIGGLIAQHPTIRAALLWAGIAFLTYYGIRSFWRAIKKSSTSLTLDGSNAGGKMQIAMAAAAFTFLNPHAILDLFVILGGIGAQHPFDVRIAFLAGTIIGSNLWFYSLGIAGQIMSPIFQNPRAWRILDGLIGIVMLAIAIKLLLQI